MVVMILESVTPSARGELTRWMVEPHPGVFVGHVSGMVRDKLWEKCCESLKKGALIQMWTSNNEQRFQMRTYGATKREVIDIDGLQLIRLPP
jgi:CRISPR-associated protein Cas2